MGKLIDRLQQQLNNTPGQEEGRFQCAVGINLYCNIFEVCGFNVSQIISEKRQKVYIVTKM